MSRAACGWRWGEAREAVAALVEHHHEQGDTREELGAWRLFWHLDTLLFGSLLPPDTDPGAAITLAVAGWRSA